MDEQILAQKWRVSSLLRFAAPTMVMMVFMGVYTTIDTIFVAQFVHTDALSAINMVCPVLNVTVGLATMLATGGNAIISRQMGMGNAQEAKENFTLLMIAAAALGFIILAVGVIKLDDIVYALGASERLFSYCADYLGTLFWFMPANVLQTVLANWFVTAGKPGLGFGLSILAGLANVLLDYIFIVLGGWGIKGAALGTGCGYYIPVLVGIIFFARGQGSLSFVKPKWRWQVLKESCLNGSSEMVGQLSTAITTFLLNNTMMALAGEEGVAAITIMIYTQFLLNAVYIGFAMGVAPIIGFHYGSQRNDGQKQVVRICLGFIMLISVVVFIGALQGGAWVVWLFAPVTSEVYKIAVGGIAIFSYGFLFSGVNNFVSAMFTALSNGKLSAVLSFLRTFVFQAGGILLLPHLCGLTGVWLAVPLAEGLMFAVSIGCLLRYRKRYGY